MFKPGDRVFSFALAAALATFAVQMPAAAQAPLTLKSASIELPTGDRVFPGGAPAEAINNNCLMCHSAGMVLNQPTLPRAAWEAEVRKMINVYKAPVAETDIAAIVAYLATVNESR